ncbi:MAG TPA: SAM-dependent methyltransferase [Puia sp.]|jgi:16S rRNA (cytidine1402-2'-O)-methyltransferase|nr:SAM-dependent methyltransferase [Puia sp.]
MKSPATVYLIPTTLDEEGMDALPAYLLSAVKSSEVFFVENERSARRFLKKIWKEMDIDSYRWFVIHKVEDSVKQEFLQQIKQGKQIAILSEAGCPGIADPGQILVSAAQDAGALVKPLVGPSSILLALMASGMNGQHFQFRGYLPIETTERNRIIRELESFSRKEGSAQIFIETPYRNLSLLDSLLKICSNETRLCIAVNLTGKSESIQTKTIETWRKAIPDINKMPAIFILQA